MALPGTESVRFRRPTSGPHAVATETAEPQLDQFGSQAPLGWKRRHQGLLQDKVGRCGLLPAYPPDTDDLSRQKNGPLIPSLSLAFRMILLVRTAGAMFAIIADCDEVFNFFEPLHYFQYNSGFQTWELSPRFAIRSWAYVLLHWPLAHLGPMFLRLGKRQAFFALRISLGFVSSFCEAKFYRAVVETVNERVGRYMLFGMIFSAGMWGASTAFLPSSFAMYTTMLACSYSFHPATSTPTGVAWAYKVTSCVALGAILGWPFSAVLGVPFVLEQLFLTGGEVAFGPERAILRSKRWDTMLKAVALGASIAIPVCMIDSWAYGRSTFPTLNIMVYNILSPSGGPELYGTSPPTYYLANLFLNFNFLLPLALLSLPALAMTYRFDHRRLGKTQQAPKEGETSPYTLLVMRLAPFYLWLAILTMQAHKEERFFFPAYPLLLFNASVGLYLVKGWMEAFYIYLTNSPYEASRTPIFSNFTLLAVLLPLIISILRVLALHVFYHAPFDVAHHFQYHSIPTVLAERGYSPEALPKDYKPYGNEIPTPRWDFSVLRTFDPPITLCFGSEWHRFPGSYLIPEGVEVQWVRSDFDGMMPRRWEASEASGIWPRNETRVVRAGRFNGANQPSTEPGTYVSPDQCDFLVALHLPSTPPSTLEPDWAFKPEWGREFCKPFLDQAGSRWWSRLLWLPGGLLDEGRAWGEYCLLRRKVGTQ